MGWWHLRLSAQILALLRLSANFFSVTVNKKVNSQFKNNLCEKAKAHTRTPNSRAGARHSLQQKWPFSHQSRIIRVRRVLRLMIRVR